jgi:hypothetical protein
MKLSPVDIHATRAARQFLLPSAQGRSDTDYLAILRTLAPMRPPSYEFPGTPVCLFDRHQASDGSSPQQVGERVRRQGLVVKARFQHNNVAYVPADEMPLFVAAFKKPRELGWDDRTVLDVLEHEGPLHKKDLAELSGIKGRALSKALENLQYGFFVFEQQLETEWDNPWCATSTEHPEWFEGNDDTRTARLEVIRRFTRAHVFSSTQEIKDWSGFTNKDLQVILEQLLRRGDLRKATVDGWGEHYLSNDFEKVPFEPCSAILDPGDPLVTAQVSYLKQDFPNMPILKYVLIDGKICGAVEGRWGIKAFDVTDVHVPRHAHKNPLRNVIIEKIRRHFPLPAQRIRKYAGTVLDAV